MVILLDTSVLISYCHIYENSHMYSNNVINNNDFYACSVVRYEFSNKHRKKLKEYKSLISNPSIKPNDIINFLSTNQEEQELIEQELGLRKEFDMMFETKKYTSEILTKYKLMDTKIRKNMAPEDKTAVGEVKKRMKKTLTPQSHEENDFYILCHSVWCAFEANNVPLTLLHNDYRFFEAKKEKTYEHIKNKYNPCENIEVLKYNFFNISPVKDFSDFSII